MEDISVEIRRTGILTAEGRQTDLFEEASKKHWPNRHAAQWNKTNAMFWTACHTWRRPQCIYQGSVAQLFICTWMCVTFHSQLFCLQNTQKTWEQIGSFILSKICRHQLQFWLCSSQPYTCLRPLWPKFTSIYSCWINKIQLCDF